MTPSLTYDKTFFNSLFTSEEFNFIDHMDSDIKDIDLIIKAEENKREIIVTFINNLRDLEDKSESYKTTASDINIIFELINTNIQLLQDCKQIFDTINQSILDLLVRIESEKEEDLTNKFEKNILNFKNIINDFSLTLEKSKSNIISNSNKINDFFEQDTVKQYLSSFSLQWPQNNVNENEKKTPTEPVLNNSVLIISEKKKKVYLPYSEKEVLEYLEQYPAEYSSFADVIAKEFILPIDFYLKHPVSARFREAYSLIRDRESKSIIDAFKFAVEIMFRYDINPTIIAACKTQDQIENYISCLDRNKLDDFSDFEIRFEIMPL